MASSINMSLDPDDVIIDTLKLLWYGRFHPGLNPRWMAILMPINLTGCGLFLALGIKGVLISYNNDIFFTTECLQTCILMSHSIGKLLVLRIYKSAFLALLEEKSHFWKIKDFDGLIFTECSKISDFSKQVIRYYYILTMMATLLFDIQPFITGQLPTACYAPDKWFNFLTVTLWFLSHPVPLSIIGTDGLFISLSISLVIQFRLLSYKFRKLVKNQSEIQLWTDFKELVDYHNSLTSYCEKLNRTFQIVFFIQFLNSIASGSISVFIFMQPGSWSNRIKTATYFLLQIAEAALYCFPSELVTNSARDVGDAIYESKWYNTTVTQFRKCLTVALAKTQKVMLFSGFGIIWINLGTFLTIFKTVFSFYTYLSSAEKIAK
ncbi:hypothetical protein MTP99_015099 [Tenebrio molitor]|nr:hypothetical protein MTP99_015099 [Tenebrio molitor]